MRFPPAEGRKYRSGIAEVGGGGGGEVGRASVGGRGGPWELGVGYLALRDWVY